MITRRFGIVRRCGLIVLAALLVTSLGPSSAVGVVAKPWVDYRMMGTVADSGGSVNTLQLECEPGKLLPALTFAKERVDGQRTTVARFVEGGGVCTGIVRDTFNGQYTVAALFRLDQVNDWERVWGMRKFSLPTPDDGLYIHNHRLKLWAGGTLAGRGSTQVAAGQWIQVVLTYNAIGRLTVFLNGVRQFRYLDTGQLFLESDSGFNRTGFQLFVDNTEGGATGEQSSGALKRLRVWLSPLTGAQVKGLDRLPPASRIVLGRTSAARTSLVKVRGRQWAPNESVTLTFVDAGGSTWSLGSFTASAVGAFATTITVPQFAAVGKAKIVAKGSLSKDQRNKALTVT